MRSFGIAFALLLTAAVVAAAQDEARVPSEDRMEAAHRAAALIVRGSLEKSRPADHRILIGISPSQVLLVEGRYDHVDRVLSRTGVPFRTVRRSAFGRMDLAPVRLLILDCPADLDRNAITRIRRYVARGGHLLTTDWAVDRVLAKAFPRTVRYTGRPTRDDVVSVRLRAPDHPYFRGAFRRGRAPRWWLESRSYPVRILNRRRVRVLVDSPEMAHEYGEGSILLTFPWRRGRVIHAVSHLYLQRSEPVHPWERRTAGEFAEDLGFGPETPVGRRLKAAGLDRSVRCGPMYSAYSIQHVLLNIVIEAVRRPLPPPPPPPPQPPEIRPGPEATVAGDTALRSGPAGRKVLAVTEGLRLTILSERDGWVQVRTPAGQTGWLATGEVSRP